MVGAIEFLWEFGARNFLEWLSSPPGRGDTYFGWGWVRNNIEKEQMPFFQTGRRFSNFPERVLWLAPLNSSGNLELGTFENGSLAHLGGENHILAVAG